MMGDIIVPLVCLGLVAIADATALLYPQETANNGTQSRGSLTGVSPFFEIDGKQYYIYDGPTVEWPTAAAACRQLGLQLVSLETQDKWDSIRNAMMDAGQFDGYSFWTSGVLLVGQSWLWSGRAESFRFTAWGPGQPNNAFGEEYCMEMHGLDSEWWHDYPCTGYHSRYICEQACP